MIFWSLLLVNLLAFICVQLKRIFSRKNLVECMVEEQLCATVSCEEAKIIVSRSQSTLTVAEQAGEGLSRNTDMP